MLYARALFGVVIVTVVAALFFVAEGPLSDSSDPEKLAQTEATPEALPPAKETPVESEKLLDQQIVCGVPAPEFENFPPDTTSATPPGVRPVTKEQTLVAKTVQSQTDFAADLYRQLSSKADGGNLFFSPHSIGTILTLTADGARGQTAKEMLQVLQLQADVDATGAPDLRDVQAAIAALGKQLAGRKDKTELAVANALWVDAGMPLRKPFVDGVLTADPAAALENVDFQNDFEAGRAKINDWTETNTAGRIKDLLAQGSLDELTRLVLTNAVYFKGDWAEKFDSSWTRAADFTLANGEKNKTPLMTATVAAGFAELDGYSILDLPYAGEKLSLLVILPDEADGLPVIEQKLNLDWLAKGVASLRKRAVQVALPKFKMETKYSLKETLSEMGMPTAFGNEANLTGLTDSPEASMLYISAVEHKAFVEVNEEGSEAAAATAVVIGFGSASPAPAPAEFIANRPFAFAIRHRESGQLLFLGRFSQPQPAQ
jgi:serpin B